MKLVHYSAAPIDELTVRKQLPPDAGAMKPVGFWVSDDDCKDNWRAFCETDEFRLDGLAYVYDVVLGYKHHGLLLNTASAIDRFTEEYALDLVPGISLGTFMDWSRVARDYSAILCTPYVWARRTDGPIWYYAWDCASGCIFDPATIASITLRETQPIAVQTSPGPLPA